MGWGLGGLLRMGLGGKGEPEMRKAQDKFRENDFRTKVYKTRKQSRVKQKIK